MHPSHSLCSVLKQDLKDSILPWPNCTVQSIVEVPVPIVADASLHRKVDDNDDRRLLLGLCIYLVLRMTVYLVANHFRSGCDVQSFLCSDGFYRGGYIAQRKTAVSKLRILFL